jgi:putative flippase GtrA
VVVTEGYSNATGTPARARKRTGWRRLLPSRTAGVRFSKFTLSSILSTALSQLTLTGLYGLGHVNATVATIAAFVVGAIPNFFINWKWTWGRDGKPAILRELLPYIAVIVVGGLAATALTTFTDHELAPLITNRAWRTVTLDVSFVASYAVLFVAKFALLNKVVDHKPATPAAETTAGEEQQAA